MERRSSENVSSIAVRTNINKSPEFQNLKFKILYYMNFEPGGRVVRNIEPKKKTFEKRIYGRASKATTY